MAIHPETGKRFPTLSLFRFTSIPLLLNGMQCEFSRPLVRILFAGSIAIAGDWTRSWYGWELAPMKRVLRWSLVGVVLYLASGLLFPAAVWHEFQWAGWGSQLPDGGNKLSAGLVDYARLYPHMILYPLFWFISAAAYLAVALHRIEKYAESSGHPRRWCWSLYFALAVFAVISGVLATLEGQNPDMLLFEISPAAQKELVSAVTNNVPAKFGQYSVAEMTLLPILSPKGKAAPEKVAELKTPEASVARQNILGWDETWSKRQEQLSSCRKFYLWTFAGMAWAVQAMFLCVGLVAAMRRDASERWPALLATIGAIVAIFLWLPHRIYYNVSTKAVLFPPDNKDVFNFHLPEVFREHGITDTEGIPILLFLIASLVVVLVIFKLPEKTARRLALAFKILTFAGALLWSFVSPEGFGKAIGLDGNLPRFIVITCLLLLLSIVYFVYTINQPDVAPSQRGSEDAHT